MSESNTQRPLQFQDTKTPMSTSLVTYPPGSAAKTKKIFDQAKTDRDKDDELDTMETNLSAYHRDRATAARLESLETFMQAQQAVQVSMQKQQADFLAQQAIFMQQVLQQMGPTTIDKQATDKQTKQQHEDKQTKQTTQDKQIKDKQKTDKARREDRERAQLGVVGSSSATAVGT